MSMVTRIRRDADEHLCSEKCKVKWALILVMTYNAKPRAFSLAMLRVAAP